MDRLGEVGSVDCWEKEDPFLIKINIHDIQGEWFEYFQYSMRVV